ncbi:MAG: glycoside hydrolase family 2 protein [Anaerolineae bacterium]
MTATDMPRPEYPRPQMVRDRWLNLNGRWQFELDPGRSGRSRGLPQAERLAGEIVVPFCPESSLSGIGNVDFMPAVWYRRTVVLPENWHDSRILLHFGAVDYDTWVYVNGREAGFHRGGYTSFNFEVTDLLVPGENVISVYAEDETPSGLQPSGKQSPRYESYACYYTRTTGIWQTVWLEPVPYDAYIASVRLTPMLQQGAVLVEARLGGYTGDADGTPMLRATAMADGAPVGAAEAIVEPGWASCLVQLEDVRAWSPEDPFLYDLRLELRCDDVAVDRVQSYFGLRSLALCGDAFLLNGKPVYQRLVLDQGFYPDGIYTAPTDEALRHDIELSMAAGFNGARLHEKVFEERFLYWADKLGYLVWGEFPNWGIDHANPLALERYMAEWPAAVERDYSHPSIVGWCPFNETPTNQNPELLRTIYRLTKTLDRTRPVIDTSGYVHVETDMWDVHDYAHGITPEEFSARYDAFAAGGEPWRNFPKSEPAWGGQPYWVSEYGGIWWNPGQAEGKAWGYGDRPSTIAQFLERYRILTEALLRNPRMTAFCYTQLTDVEQEVNGLYRYDRSAKFDEATMAEVRRINRGPAAIEG